ncbi:uncharacterized protein [Dermacentor albipictus]|uniref:uncharacterized protein isoform X2 n=1 Tax=Dermacentor albipictus TaxID=60249 RepID=UPI0031FD29BB
MSPPRPEFDPSSLCLAAQRLIAFKPSRRVPFSSECEINVRYTWLWLIFIAFVLLIIGLLVLFFLTNTKSGVYREQIIVSVSEPQAPGPQIPVGPTARPDDNESSETAETITEEYPSADVTTPGRSTGARRHTSASSSSAVTTTTKAAAVDGEYSSTAADLSRHNDRLLCVFSGGRKTRLVLPADGVCKYVAFHSVVPAKQSKDFTSPNNGEAFDAFMVEAGKFRRTVPLLSIAKHAWDKLASKGERVANVTSALEVYADRGIGGFGCALYYHTLRYAPDSKTHLALLSEDFRKMLRSPLLFFLGLVVVGSGHGLGARDAAIELARSVVEHVDLLVVVSHVPADRNLLQETESLRHCLVTAASGWRDDHLGNKNLQSTQRAVDVLLALKDSKARLFVSATMGVWKYAVAARSIRNLPTLGNMSCDSRELVPFAEVCKKNFTVGNSGEAGIAYDYDLDKSTWRSYETPESISFKIQRVFRHLKDAQSAGRAGFWALYDVEMDDWDGECHNGTPRKPVRLYKFADLTAPASLQRITYS